MAAETYGDLFSFHKLHTEVYELVQESSRVLVCPDLAGRVMTSSCRGPRGLSFGWVNCKAFVAARDPHFTNFGGEERLWLGPEGGQFSVFFAPKKEFTLENWYVPKCFNEDPYALLEAEDTELSMCKNMILTNWSGTRFNVTVERTIRILDREEIQSSLDLDLPDSADTVAFSSENLLINRASEQLKKETGLLSIWLLNMLHAGEKTFVVVPVRSDTEGGTGPLVKDDYFGPVPSDRLIRRENLLLFRADAKYRSKIGVGPGRVRDRLGSVDLKEGILTVVTFSLGTEEDYVNSAWELQEEPYRGDVVNSYNDGPPPGEKEGFGNFYELETSSPAKELEPGQSLAHTQTTYHFQADGEILADLAKKLLGIAPQEIAEAFGLGG